MRLPFLSEIYFSASFMLFVVFVYFFNSAYFYGEEICRVELRLGESGCCEVAADSTRNVRIISNYSYLKGKRLRVRPQLDIELANSSGVYTHNKTFQKSGSSSLGNFGVFDIVGDSGVNVSFVGGDNPGQIYYLNVVVSRNPSVAIASIFTVLSFVFLYLSIYKRQVVFKRGPNRALPYLLYVLLVLINIIWIANS